MSESTRQQLQQALELVSTGKKQEAVRLLTAIIKADRDNDDAWWLLANALDDPAQIRLALQNVLRLRPDSIKAQQMLSRMELESTLSAPVEAASETASTDFADEPVEDDYTFLYQEDKPQPTPAVATQSQVTIQNSIGRPIHIPTRKTRSASSGMSWGSIILISVGVLFLVGVAACAFIGLNLANTYTNVVQQLENAEFGSVNIENAVVRGTIVYGQSLQGNVDTIEDDAWTFQGNRGDNIIIEVFARDNNLDPEVALFDAANQQLDYNDDIVLADNRNSRIEFTLPASGKYTIVVSAFGIGGAYELSLRRQ